MIYPNPTHLSRVLLLLFICLFSFTLTLQVHNCPQAYKSRDVCLCTWGNKAIFVHRTVNKTQYNSPSADENKVQIVEDYTTLVIAKAILYKIRDKSLLERGGVASLAEIVVVACFCLAISFHDYSAVKLSDPLKFSSIYKWRALFSIDWMCCW